MATNWPPPGINHVGEFQSSGHTLAIAAGQDVRLKFVASAITATCGTSAGSITFYDGSHNSQSVTVGANSSIRFTGKFLTFSTAANTTAVVEVTNIPSGSYVPPDFADMKH